jgi:hypothetical protein
VLHWIAIMASDTVETSRDWLRSPRTTALAWWIPHGAIIAALILPVLPDSPTPFVHRRMPISYVIDCQGQLVLHCWQGRMDLEPGASLP